MSGKDCFTVCCNGVCPPVPICQTSTDKSNVQRTRQDKPPPPRVQERLPVRQCLLERPAEPVETKYGPTAGVRPIVRTLHLISLIL